MATPSVTPSTSRRTREHGHGEMAVGSFRRLEEIGRGSFATVYKASYSKKPGYVAIKSVDMHKLNKKLKENLYSEIHILKGLHHPHIVALIDCQETTAHIHLVMEFCELGDLSYFIKKRDTLSRHDTTADMIRKYPNPPAGGLNEVIVRHFLKQLACALEFLRVRNFIHRDIKPQNLLLDPSPLYYSKVKPETAPYVAHDQSLNSLAGVESLPTLKIADFGFARSLPSTSLAETLCGSPLYMAPEILRYEKYDAKADLWSVGTVLYEMMVGKPPFRASNHVELLRKIERGEDRIRFPEDAILTDPMKKIIRGLLKRNPVERMSFVDFFNNVVVKGEIPGLVDEDRTVEPAKPEPELSVKKTASTSDLTPGHGYPSRVDKPGKNVGDTTKAVSQPPKQIAPATRADPPLRHRNAGTPPRTGGPYMRSVAQNHDLLVPNQDSRIREPQPRRPSIVSHATAPARQDLHTAGTRNVPAVAMQRQSSRNPISAKAITFPEKAQTRERLSPRIEDKAAQDAREAQERAAQDVAFERDYVLVEKRAVEVNAFADELAASPRIHGVAQAQQDPHRGAMVRRATTQGPPGSTTGAHVTPSRAIQLASGKRADPTHLRQASYERRIRDPTSATSAISKALTMASGRLLSMGFSPPLGLGRGGISPPSYSPFPAYPTNASLVMIDDGHRRAMPLDEDTKAVHIIEESASRSDVVYGFAEVKYKQLIPLAPSMEHGLGLRRAGIPEGAEVENSSTDDDGLTVDAIVTLSEEALVLYVKALSLLAKSMDIAGAWWARKNRGEITEESTSPRTRTSSSNSVAIGNRVNNVVQWVRSRFNEVLEKAEFVRLKLIEAQKQLPQDHPSHPRKHPSASSSEVGMGTSADNVIVSPGVTAEKLMFDRALEMSRSAAVNELVGDDLPGCEIAYITAIRMLEAVLVDDEDAAPRDRSLSDEGTTMDENAINGVEVEDRKAVLKMVQGIRSRLAALRKKIQVLSKRTNVIPATAPPSKPPALTNEVSTPALASTPPR